MLNTKTVKRLRKDGVPINDNLPPVIINNLRSSKDIAKRINILGVFIAIADDSSSIGFFTNLLKEQNMDDFLSEKEREVLDKGKLSKQKEIDLSWYQESLYALVWCLGIINVMEQPKDEADLYPIFKYLPPEVELNEFIAESNLIDRQIILEETEYYYGLHWGVKHPESWSFLNRLTCKKYNMSIVKERRKALEWVIDNSLSWDDIPLDT